MVCFNGIDSAGFTPLQRASRVQITLLFSAILYHMFYHIPSYYTGSITGWVGAQILDRRMGFDMRSQKRINPFYQQLSVQQ